MLGCVIGDLRNKFAKIERAAAEKADIESWLRERGWKPEPPSIPEYMVAIVCPGCLHNHREKEIYFISEGRWGPKGYWCLDCMPQKIKDFWRL